MNSNMNQQDYQLTGLITVIRHGEKHSETGELTETGFFQAMQKAVRTLHLNGEVKMYHSGVARVKHTVETLSHLLSKEDEIKEAEAGTILDSLKEVEELSSYEDARLSYLFDPSNKGTYFAPWSEVVDYQSAKQRAQDFLNFNGVSPEKGIVPSPREMAMRLTAILLEQIREALATPKEQKTNFLVGTHEPVLLSFLYYFLTEFKGYDKDFIERIGGSVNFAEGFDIKIYQSDNDYFLRFEFREYTIDFGIEKLEGFI